MKARSVEVWNLKVLIQQKTSLCYIKQGERREPKRQRAGETEGERENVARERDRETEIEKYSCQREIFLTETKLIDSIVYSVTQKSFSLAVIL